MQYSLLVKVYAHQAAAAASASASDPMQVYGDAWVDAWNGSGTNFQVSQCIPMDPDAAAQCAYTLKVIAR